MRHPSACVNADAVAYNSDDACSPQSALHPAIQRIHVDHTSVLIGYDCMV